MSPGVRPRKTTRLAEILGASGALVAFAGCSAYVVTAMAGHSGSPDINYVAHVRDHGVSHGVTQVIGHAVCGDLERVHSAAAEVSRVSAGAEGDAFSGAESEVIVYWAAHDLCPAEISRIPVSWEDGG